MVWAAEAEGSATASKEAEAGFLAAYTTWVNKQVAAKAKEIFIFQQKGSETEQEKKKEKEYEILLNNLRILYKQLIFTVENGLNYNKREF